jgi:hypothetical protein
MDPAFTGAGVKTLIPPANHGGPGEDSLRELHERTRAQLSGRNVNRVWRPYLGGRGAAISGSGAGGQAGSA